MTIRPIIFSGPMVRALLGGNKTQTRRTAKGIDQMPDGSFHVHNAHGGIVGVDETDVPLIAVDYMPYVVGDLLYVRERAHIDGKTVSFAADMPAGLDLRGMGFGPAIHMPRSASRITLKVTGVKVERVQDISEEDAQAEGVEGTAWDMCVGCRDYTTKDNWFYTWPGAFTDDGLRLVEPEDIYQRSFQSLWNSINAERGYGWDANPWVVAVSFEVIKANVDSLANSGPGD